MKLNQFLLFTLCITFFSCSTESSNDDKETNDSTLIKKIIYNKDTDDEYIEIYNYEGNKLISVDADDSYKNVYTYENNNLIKDEYFVDGKLIAYTTLEYDADETLASYIETFLEGSGLDDRQYKHFFTYNNDSSVTDKAYINYNQTEFKLDHIEDFILDGKNIVQISTSYTNDEEYKSSFKYDDKKNAFKNIHAIEILNILSENEYGLIIYGNTNNITNYIEDDTGSIDDYNDNYEYIYNEEGYPKSSIYTSKYDNKIEDTETIEYFYE